jgi:hypothetical protein
MATGTRMIAVIDGRTFYDLGGAIAPNTKFLIGVNRSLEHVNIYALEEVPKTAVNIFWGEVLEDVSRSLDSVARGNSR